MPSGPEVRELLRLALPVVVVQVGMMSLGVVDTLMVGRVSTIDLAAVALGNVYFFFCAIFGMGVLFALDPVISHAMGAGDEEGIARGLQRGLVMSLLLTVLASLMLLPAEAALTLARQPDEVIPVAAGYALATIPGIFPFYAFAALRQTLQVLGRLAPIVWTILLANVANVLFNWILIFGKWGFPELGAVGSGWASSLSRGLMAVVLLALSWPALAPYLRRFRPEALLRRPLIRMFKLGAPIGLQMSFEFGAFGMAGLMMGWMGTVAVAGHQIALNLSALTFMVPVGVGQATAVLVGRAVGRADPPGARRAAVGGLILGVGFMTLTAVLFTMAPVALSRAYTSEIQVVALASILLPIAGVFQVFDGIQIVSGSILRGVGDTRVPMLMNLLGFFAVGLPVGVLLAFGFDIGPRGIWWGLAVGLASVSVLLAARVRARMGRELRRVVLDDEPGSNMA